MEQKVLEVLKNNDKPLTIYEINDLLGLKSSDELRELQATLTKLEENYDIYRSKKNRFLSVENSHLKKGRLSVSVSGRYGYVDVEGLEKGIKIDESKMNGAIHNDTVIVDIINHDNNEGKILKVVKRDDADLVGEYYVKDGQGYVKMDNHHYKDYVIDPQNSKGAVPGHKVLVKRIKDLGNGCFQGEVEKILGHKDDVGVDILSIVYEYGIPDVFSPEVTAELEGIPSSISKAELEGRRDLRDVIAFTIDGDSTKDFDQASDIKKLDNGNYLLRVHIADVSYYVKEDSAIGKEAYNRGTSIYLVDRVIPMLPHTLSNGITSLDEGVDRLAITCEMEINPQGNVIKYDIYTSVINSRKKMTYSNVNKIIESNEMVDGYEPFVDDLKLMADLSAILRKNRIARGYLDFDTDEMNIIVDENGEPIEITKRYRGVAENIIEDQMIVTNETIGTHFHYLDTPLIYRVHEKPDEKRITQFITFINSLGYRIKSNSKKFDAQTMQEILKMLQEKEEWRVLSNMALRTMKKAKYSPDNVGHFGLGLKYYAHFTAPNRRLPDLIVQRELKESLKIPGYRSFNHDELVIYADHASLTEDRAVKCERAVDKYESAKYMMNHIGEEYDAIISSISRDGIWVQLDNLVEGLIKISEIGDDYFDVDEDLQIVKGRRTGKMYRIGQKIRVVVTGASKEDSEIDFAFVKDEINKSRDAYEKKKTEVL